MLAPWQKLEVFRAHVLPSLSHHLESGRVQRGFLNELNTRCVEFLRQVSFVPHTTHKAFLFLENWAGELGASQLKKDADVWTVARSVHCWTAKTKSSASWPEPRGLDQATYGPLPLSKFLPGLTQGVLYDNRVNRCGLNTWTHTRKAARRLHVKIDVSSDSSLSKVIADDVSCL